MLFCTFKAITFVCEIKADYLNKNGNVKDDLYELKAYKGHNFETFVSRKENSENRESVSYESGYNAIFASTLEIDCFDPADGKMIELKTNQTENFSPSWALQAWLQSHLVMFRPLWLEHATMIVMCKK
uniref:Decapping nuclease n=1 Tax=Ditylenchus dipsaci TaxID=166011 RepID=A0A915E2D5_9BILA